MFYLYESIIFNYQNNLQYEITQKIINKYFKIIQYVKIYIDSIFTMFFEKKFYWPITFRVKYHI